MEIGKFCTVALRPTPKVKWDYYFGKEGVIRKLPVPIAEANIRASLNEFVISRRQRWNKLPRGRVLVILGSVTSFRLQFTAAPLVESLKGGFRSLNLYQRGGAPTIRDKRINSGKLNSREDGDGETIYNRMS